MTATSKVSIIIPMYNAADTIGHLLDCLAVQTYRNFEVVIVNDRSSDNSMEVCRRYENQLPLVLVDLPENGGVSNARNVGMEHADGAYFLFIDSDDYVTPTYIEHLMVSETDDFVVSGYTRPGRAAAEIGQELCVSTEEFRARCFDLWSRVRVTNVWGVRYSAELIRRNHIRFEAGMRWGEDTLFNVHYLGCCKTMRSVGFQDYVYCVNPISLSKRYEPTRHDDALKVAKALSGFITDPDQEWKIMFMYWEMSARHYLNHLHDPMDAAARKELCRHLSRSEGDAFFRQYLPQIIQGGTLDMKLYALCLKHRCSRCFPFLNECLMLLSRTKEKLTGGAK